MTAARADALGPLERARLALWIIDHPDECAAPLLSVEERARLRAYGYWRARRLGLWVVLAARSGGRRPRTWQADDPLS